MKWTLRISSSQDLKSRTVFQSFQLHPTLIFPISLSGGKFQTEDQNEAQKTTMTTNRVCRRDNRIATNHRTANRSMRDLTINPPGLGALPS